MRLSLVSHTSVFTDGHPRRMCTKTFMKRVLVVASALRNASVEDGAWQLLGEYGFIAL